MAGGPPVRSWRIPLDGYTIAFWRGPNTEHSCQIGTPSIVAPVVQLMALGELASIQEARQLVATMAALRRYEPEDRTNWQDAYERYKDVTKMQS